MLGGVIFILLFYACTVFLTYSMNKVISKLFLNLVASAVGCVLLGG